MELAGMQNIVRKTVLRMWEWYGWNFLESESCSVMSDSLQPHRPYSPWNSPGQNTGVGSLSFLQRIFPTQESNTGLAHCRWILYHLRHKGSPRMLEWVVFPFSSGSSQPRNQTWVSCITGSFFTNWATKQSEMKVTQLCLTLCNPMDYMVHGILQARILENSFPSPGDLPNPGIEPRSPTLWADSLPAEPQGKSI